MWDVIVAGLGAHGSAAVYELARRGAPVLGLERFARGHTLASSGGRSRIIRLSYFEHPDYVPLLRRAWDRWRELERDGGETLLTQTGGLYAGPRDGQLVRGALASARTHGLAHELLDGGEIRRRYPVLEVEREWVGVVEEQAGWLAPERCIETHLRLAERHGAMLRFGVPVERWERWGDEIVVSTVGERYRAKRLVLTAGAWMDLLLPELAPHLWVERAVLFWFEPTAQRNAFAKLPVYIVEEGERMYYGFPLDPDNGVKVAGLHFGERVRPNVINREVNATDEERVRRWLRRRMPLANGRRRMAKVCMYTNTPDGHFVIDRLGDDVVYASACSGHGFKFASVIGEILADLALDGRTDLPIEFLSAARL